MLTRANLFAGIGKLQEFLKSHRHEVLISEAPFSIDPGLKQLPGAVAGGVTQVIGIPHSWPILVPHSSASHVIGEQPEERVLFSLSSGHTYEDESTYFDAR